MNMRARIRDRQFAELDRLVGNGSITKETYEYHVAKLEAEKQ